ncbi:MULTISPECIES: FAD-dependent oxidoreductase [unclassified Amycolatopsis]|uniref:NAD(P)/FAD-dependent oxidoreductase n=1 Tax=unclassified Amycolatopsis TaxID=2618356 RepID=UPI0028748788|nr:MULTISPECIES: FAD-dependent oxidoreductase [unclassified Amycolatopsis]MDS0132107.1 FAD-dependent oxidoreductase [Amycolatopsis sp. 505]MDS0141155.1 FAD-dependent oxidoreductase [Amycolatopsis sp. CM201R]
MKRVAVVGASLAGVRAAQELRAQGYDGGIVLIGDEVHLPYDRPPLSKGFLAGTASRESLDLLDAGDLASLALDFRLGVRATALAPADRRVLLSDGTSVHADGVVIATGGRARTLPGFEGAFVLRTLDDALALRAALVPGVRVAIVGAGFIGAEVASTCRSLGLDVVVLEALAAPLAPVLGPSLAEVCARLHLDHGTDLRCGVRVTGLSPAGVSLASGAVVPADVVVTGVGMTPSTEWLEGSGLKVGNGVHTDEGLVTSLPQVVAVGDVARYGGRRHEHWTNASEQAPVAVANLLAGHTTRTYTPSGYVWSDQYSGTLQLAGHPRPDDELTFVAGDPASASFVATFSRDGATVGVFALNDAKLFNRLRRQALRRPEFQPAVQG